MFNGITPITVVGNLTGDPELRYTPSGVAVAKFSIAVNIRVKGADDKYTDGDPSFYSVTAWRQLAENACESLSKGTRVIVSGTLRQRHWVDDKQEKRSSWELTADAIGPDLSWATASVKKLTRRSEAPPDDPWATAEPVASS